jgi:hypothetical protein
VEKERRKERGQARAAAAGTKATPNRYDHWAKTGGMYKLRDAVVMEAANRELEIAAVRVHDRPRWTLFSPSQVKGGFDPSDVHEEQLTVYLQEKDTVTDGPQLSWDPMRNQRRWEQPWTGVTVFFRKQDGEVRTDM